MRAFPAAVDLAAGANASSWFSSEEAVVLAYEWRVLEGFVHLLGLAKVEVGRSREDFGRVVRVRATPELAEVVAERVG